MTNEPNSSVFFQFLWNFLWNWTMIFEQHLLFGKFYQIPKNSGTVLSWVTFAFASGVRPDSSYTPRYANRSRVRGLSMAAYYGGTEYQPIAGLRSRVLSTKKTFCKEKWCWHHESFQKSSRNSKTSNSQAHIFSYNLGSNLGCGWKAICTEQEYRQKNAPSKKQPQNNTQTGWWSFSLSSWISCRDSSHEKLEHSVQ